MAGQYWLIMQSAKRFTFLWISNFNNTKVLVFTVFVKTLGSIVFLLSIKYTKIYLASFLKIWSKKLRWKSGWCRLIRSSHRRCSIKKTVLKIFSIFTVLESFFIKAGGMASNFIEIETPTQFSFCEYCGIFKNICQRLLLTPLEKTLVIKTKLLDLLLMLVIALAN